MKRVTRIITTAAIILAIIFLGTRVSTLNDPASAAERQQRPGGLAPSPPTGRSRRRSTPCWRG